MEAEHHAVWRKATGDVVCITPQTPQESAVTFIPDPSATYDLTTGLMNHNVRVALVNDSRMQEFFKLCERQTDIMNKGRLRAGAPPFVELTGEEQWELMDINSQKVELGSAVLSHEPQYGKVGRNKPCPCGSGKKFKRCHGA